MNYEGIILSIVNANFLCTDTAFSRYANGRQQPGTFRVIIASDHFHRHRNGIRPTPPHPYTAFQVCAQTLHTYSFNRH